MSKQISSDTLLSVFPIALSADEHLSALSASAAVELASLYKSGNLAALYTRIDELEGDLLDILAYDFKIDWWDADYSVDEKRMLFKSCWEVHRKLGTPAAIVSALKSIYPGASIREWWQYGGQPYHFRILIDTGSVFPDYNKLQFIVSKTQFYKNLRSVLEEIDLHTQKSTQIYIGFALQYGAKLTMHVPGIDPNEYTMIIDEQGNYLTDEDMNILID